MGVPPFDTELSSPLQTAGESILCWKSSFANLTSLATYLSHYTIGNKHRWPVRRLISVRNSKWHQYAVVWRWSKWWNFSKKKMKSKFLAQDYTGLSMFAPCFSFYVYPLIWFVLIVNKHGIDRVDRKFQLHTNLGWTRRSTFGRLRIEGNKGCSSSIGVGRELGRAAHRADLLLVVVIVQLQQQIVGSELLI